MSRGLHTPSAPLAWSLFLLWWAPAWLSSAVVFGSSNRTFVDSLKTAWESLLLLANGHDTKRAKRGAPVDRANLRQIDLHCHDLRQGGACRLLADVR
jgi:hypothetical protein